MEGIGYIKDELDTKILILIILNHLIAPVSHENLYDLALFDPGLNYFVFSDCLASLVRSKHVEQIDTVYQITQKGRDDSEVTEDSLPFSVRNHAKTRAAKFVKTQQRDALLQTQIIPRENGFTVKLAVSDDVGKLFDAEIYAANEKQASALVNGFRKKAEQVYMLMIEFLQNSEN